jgi:isoleucyl-tRNA synthetase
MALYKEVESQPNFPKLDDKIISYWDEIGIIRKVTTTNFRDQPIYSFLEGPPTANGHPGSHHIESRTFKDTVCKYKAMKGFYVPRKAGWDTHGLPVELEVEKELGFESKEDILEYGVGNFNKKCKESVFKYQGEWEDITKRIGFWIDMEHPYITYTNDYIESVWWSLKQIHDADLLYKGYKILPYCTRCGTALSSHEVAQGYKNIEEPSVFIRFKAKEFENTSFLAWTTTPWTLISNLALAVNADEKYVWAKCDKESFIVAKEKLFLIKDQAANNEPEILGEYWGADLMGKSYEPLYDFHKLEHPAIWRIITADWVTMEDGSGIVHTAPAFGEVDYEAGLEFGLPMYNPIKLDGEFEDEVEPFKGMFVKEADPLITKDLDDRGLLFYTMPYKHDYPFCWRCDMPLLYYASDTWFIKTTAVQDRLLANNEKINWYPNHLKHGRFGNFLDGVRDWALSRSRYWGTPLPIWLCEECGHETAIGSFQELADKVGFELTDDFDPHKPFVDDMIIPCPECGKDSKRVEEVIDCWYDSGASTFAQFHYPFENKEEFDSRFPYDFISEGVDQTRGWFYTLHAIGSLVFDKPAYTNVISLGLVWDEKGEKMSKSKGNIVDPFEVVAKLGADALKFYFAVQSPWSDKKFGMGQVREKAYPLLNSFWGSYFFYVTYANLDNFDPTKSENQVPTDKRPAVDRWLLSRYNKALKDINTMMDNYEIHKATERAADFVIQDLSLWYVRVCRGRFWQEEITPDKLAALNTLYEVLVGCSKAFAPLVSFISEEVYQNLVGSVREAEESVLLDEFPAADESLISEDLEDEMSQVQDLIKLVRRMRERVKIKTRQPLSTLVISSPEDIEAKFSPYLWIIELETNVKEILFKAPDDLGEYTVPQIKPNKKALGPILKGDIKCVEETFECLDSEEVMQALECEGFKTTIGSTEITLTKNEIEVSTQPKADYVSENICDMSLLLCTEINKELKLEGLMRELIRRIQVMRKDAALDYDSKIDVFIDTSNPDIKETVDTYGDKIKAETQTINFRDSSEGMPEVCSWDIEDKSIQICIKKV